MLTSEELAALRDAIPADPDRAALLVTLEQRAAPLLARLPPIPRTKALLSSDGGFCPRDLATLVFDPWSPDSHRCPRCGERYSGERHHRNWARAQHLWLAERTAELALLADVVDNRAAGARAAELLAVYDDLYFELPNRDNVLGPTHLFFSTYLESLWITSYLAGGFLLREAGLLPEDRIAGIDRVAEEAAAIIGEFNEGLSNRQTWHAAALLAIAAWFNDSDLAASTVEARTGLLGHLTDGFGEDGLWWEGENYHLFALRGLMQGIHWARALGFDLLSEPELQGHFRSALLAPALTALPDLTYPARRDSRYGVSLAQPAALELWEIGRAWVEPDAGGELDAWLTALYQAPLPATPAERYDAWLHDAGREAPTATGRRRRTGLSWWALTAMAEAPESPEPWRPQSALLATQGYAVLRHEDGYAALECGPEIGGHGHPDRLHLTLHDGRVHWLPDPGAGSYVHQSLHWYRSDLAHNAPRIDGRNAGGADAWCEAFDAEGEFTWCSGQAGELRRTVVYGPGHLLDLLELTAGEERLLEVPWHFQGEVEVKTKGRWEPVEFLHPFVSRPERFVPEEEAGNFEVVAWDRAGRRLLRILFHAPGAELIEATAPGLPTNPEPRPFLLLRARAERVRWVTVLEGADSERTFSVKSLMADPDRVTVATEAGETRYQFTESGLRLTAGAETNTLGGLRQKPAPHRSVFEERHDPRPEALSPRIHQPPALDGTLTGFDQSAPLALDDELQYRRSEEPYDPERFSATAWVNWDADALYLAVAVRKAEVLLRPPDADPLALDNEAEDINSDSLQVYFRPPPEAALSAFLVTPQADGGIRSRSLGPAADGTGVRGRWKRTSDGYLVTLQLDHPAIHRLGPGVRVGFDLLVNEMRPDRLRRAGQLVWGGSGGWIYLRGDRHDPSRLGTLELG